MLGFVDDNVDFRSTRSQVQNCSEKSLIRLLERSLKQVWSLIEKNLPKLKISLKKGKIAVEN